MSRPTVDLHPDLIRSYQRPRPDPIERIELEPVSDINAPAIVGALSAILLVCGLAYGLGLPARLGPDGPRRDPPDGRDRPGRLGSLAEILVR